MIANLYNIPVSSVKLVPNVFDKERYLLHYENWELYLRLGLKLKKEMHRVLQLNQSQWLKPYVPFNTQKRLEAERMGAKTEKRGIKPSYLSQKTFDNDLVAIRING